MSNLTIKPLKKKSINLFDSNATTYHYYYNSSGQYVVAVSVSLSDWIEVKPNTTYVLSGVSIHDDIVRRINLFDADKTWMSQPSVSTTYPLTVTTTSSTKYIRFSFGQTSESTIDTNIMFVKGSTAPSSYIPYGYSDLPELYKKNPDWVVPSGYTQVEYVQNSAATRVPTGVIPSSVNNEIYVRFYCADTNSMYLIQSRGGTTQGDNIYGLSGSVTGGTILYLVNGVLLSSSITRTPGHIYIVRGSCDGTTMTLYVKDETDGTEATNTCGFSGSYVAAETQIGLFGNYLNNTIGSGYRIFECYYKENNVMLLNLVAATYGTTNGFYDTVSKTFKTADNGSLTTGSRIQDYSYLGELYKKNPNLFDKDGTLISGFVNSETSVLQSPTSAQKSTVMQVKPNTTYTISGSSSTVGLFTSSPAIGSTASSIYPGSSSTTQTFTTGANETYLVTLVTWSGGSWMDTLKIVEGTSDYQHIFSSGYATTVTGNPATIPDARAKPIDYELTGNSSQENYHVGKRYTNPITISDGRASEIGKYEISGNLADFVEIEGTKYKVPSGYTRLSYLKGDGSSYVLTGLSSYKNTYTYKVVIKPADTSTRFVFGQNPGIGSNNIGMYNNSAGYTIQNGAYTRSSVGASATGFHTIIIESDGYTVDGEKTAITPVTEFTVSSIFPLFAAYGGDTTGFDTRMSMDYIAGFDILDENSNLILAMRPMEQSDGTLGMYDFISNTFQTNQSTGSFTAGNKYEKYEGVGDKCNLHPEVPDTYTELEYLESSGTQYINTGYVPTSENFKAEFAIQGAAASKNTFGFMNNTTDGNWFTDYGTGNDNISFYIGSSGRVTTCSVSDKTDISIETTSSKALTVKINGTQQGSTSFTGTVLGDTGNFCLFTVGSTTYTPGRLSTTKVYYCRLYQDGVLVRALIPAKRNSDSVLGMYDTVNDVFYTNSGTGTFIAGPEAYGYKLPILKAENCGCVDLGTLEWIKNNDHRVSANISDLSIPATTATVLSAYADGYTVTDYNSPRSGTSDHVIANNNGDSSIVLYLVNGFTNVSTSAEIQAIIGHLMFYYQRSTDTSWTAPTISSIYTTSQLNRVYRGGEVDLGDLTWTKYSGENRTTFYAAVSDAKIVGSGNIPDVYIPGYTTVASTNYTGFGRGTGDMETTLHGTVASIQIANNSYSGLTATEFKAAMKGRKLYYQTASQSYWTAPTFDTIDSDGVRTNQIGKIVFDGTESWTYDSQSNRFYTQIPLAKLPSVARTMPAECTHFEMLCNGESSFSSGEGYIGTDSDSVATVFLHTTEITSLTDWQTWLASAGMTLWYILDTATTETVTVPEIDIIEGTNHIEVQGTPVAGLYTEYKKLASATSESDDIVAPTPEYPSDVESCGDKTENVFDGVSELGGYGDGTGVKCYMSKWRTGNFIQVTPGEIYAINSINKPSWATFTRLNVYEYDADKNWIRSDTNTGWIIGSTFAIPSDVYYITLSSFGTVVTTTKLAEEFGDTLIMVKGSTAPSSYIPYGYKFPLLLNNTTTYNIYDDSQLRKVDTYADTIDSDGVRTNNIGVYEITGTESWSIGSSSSMVRFHWDVGPTGIADNANMICSHYVNGSGANNTISGGNSWKLQLTDTRFTTVDELKAWLAAQYAAGTPVIVYYELATATTESITPQDISTVKGTNYLQCTTSVAPSALEVTYCKKTKAST